MKRCGWVSDDPVYIAYHDTEWGVPVRDDRLLFEFLILEGFQAGLAWITILKKRENFRKAFAGFDPERVARFTERDQKRLLADKGIVRNRLKIDAAVRNARAFLDIQEQCPSFSDYIWDFVDGSPVKNRFARMEDVPAETPLSVKISKDLKKRGFRFVGPTIVYAHMQATGMVNDHLTHCFRHSEL